MVKDSNLKIWEFSCFRRNLYQSEHIVFLCIAYLISKYVKKKYLFYILLSKPLGPPDKPVLGPSINVAENENFEMECLAANAYPNGSLHWFLNNNDITEFAESHPPELDTNGRYTMHSKLKYTIGVTREDNNQPIRCEVRHQTLSSPLSSSDQTLTVKCKS